MHIVDIEIQIKFMNFICSLHPAFTGLFPRFTDFV